MPSAFHESSKGTTPPRERSAPGGLPVLPQEPSTDYPPLPDGEKREAARSGPYPAAVYIHVPFCASKCHYCDFYSLAGHLDRAEPYLAALENEFRILGDHFGSLRPETVFIGGGTPTLLPPDLLERLLTIVARAIDSSEVVEYSIEANPNTFDATRAAILAGHGVNRISFGAQSFVPAELAALQRDHAPESVFRACDIARRAGLGNINLDLIFGIPGQSLGSWDFSLGQAIALAPSHLSAYSLIYEPHTPMTARLEAGQIKPLDEDTELALFNHTYARLREAGYERYETSNYALRGSEGRPLACRHNLHYWSGADYVGLGPSGASGYQPRNGGPAYHWKNVTNLAHYLTALEGPLPRVPVTGLETLSPVRRAAELIMLGLRLTAGVEYAAVRERTGVDPRYRVAGVLARYAGCGFFEETPRNFRLTEKGTVVADGLVREMMGAMEG